VFYIYEQKYSGKSESNYKLPAAIKTMSVTQASSDNQNIKTRIWCVKNPDIK
jgi:hypothetical protein